MEKIIVKVLNDTTLLLSSSYFEEDNIVAKIEKTIPNPNLGLKRSRIFYKGKCIKVLYIPLDRNFHDNIYIDIWLRLTKQVYWKNGDIDFQNDCFYLTSEEIEIIKCE